MIKIEWFSIEGRKESSKYFGFGFCFTTEHFFFKNKNVVTPPKKNRCHFSPVPPHNGHPSTRATSSPVSCEVRYDDWQRRNTKSLSSVSVRPKRTNRTSNRRNRYWVSLLRPQPTYLYKASYVPGFSWFVTSIGLITPTFLYNFKMLFLCRVRKVLEDRAMGDIERVMKLFLFIFHSSLFWTVVWRSGHACHASVKLLFFKFWFIFVFLLFNSKLSLKQSCNKKKKSMHLQKLKLKK